MVVTDDAELNERCRMIRNLCFRKDVRYVHDEISDNYRFFIIPVDRTDYAENIYWVYGLVLKENIQVDTGR